jgi:hypothetical protein
LLIAKKKQIIGTDNRWLFSIFDGMAQFSDRSSFNDFVGKTILVYFV